MESSYDTQHKHASPTQSLSSANPLKRIGVALFNGFALPDVAALIEIFQAANALSESDTGGSAQYEVSLLSAAGGRIASSSAVFVWTESVESRRRSEHFHALYIGGGAGAVQAFRDDRLVAWLRQTCAVSSNVQAIAEGRLLLEAVGIAGSETTDTADSGIPRAASTVRPAAHLRSPLRSALRIVENDLGAGIAQQVADWVAPREKSQFSAIVGTSAAGHVSEKIRASARWIEANGANPISVDAAARVATMSERNFLRRFKAEMGVTPSDYLLYVRLDMICKLLAETNLPVDKIARRCGIGSGGRLAKLFRKHLSLTPTEYRASRQIGRHARIQA